MNKAIECLNRRSGHYSEEYTVHIPNGVIISDAELITRCDNYRFDLNRKPGSKYHFGGTVEHQDGNIAIVTVYID